MLLLHINIAFYNGIFYNLNLLSKVEDSPNGQGGGGYLAPILAHTATVDLLKPNIATGGLKMGNHKLVCSWTGQECLWGVRSS